VEVVVAGIETNKCGIGWKARVRHVADVRREPNTLNQFFR
jgi:hypothetical protein